MTAYYNENDPFAAQWLRNLIAAGHIAPGVVDERSIEDVTPDDLRGFTQCHFFAGIGVWSLALRRAGWPDDKPVWTGSCPCQPFSAAGKGKGIKDSRHLWPVWFRLIKQCRPPVIFGEQVASKLACGDGKANVRELWDRKAILGLCQNWLERESAEYLQNMQKCRCEGVEFKQEGLDIIQGKQARCRSQSESNSQGNTFQPNSEVASAETGCWDLRSERNTIRPFNQQGLEYSFTGQGYTGKGLYAGEHSRCFICSQCGMWRLGRSKDFKNSINNNAEKTRGIAKAIASINREIERKNGNSWINTLQTDLEATNYAVGAVDLCAAGFGAPHIRQRLFWVADSDNAGLEGRKGMPERSAECPAGSGNMDGRMGDSKHEGLNPNPLTGSISQSKNKGWMLKPEGPDARGNVLQNSGPTNGYWRDADWLFCRDDKWRPVEPGTSPLADGVAGRVGKLRAYGNAIVAPVAEEFIRAYMLITEE